MADLDKAINAVTNVEAYMRAARLMAGFYGSYAIRNFMVGQFPNRTIPPEAPGIVGTAAAAMLGYRMIGLGSTMYVGFRLAERFEVDSTLRSIGAGTSTGA